MNINLKYKLGDEVYVVYKEDDRVQIFKDKIVELAMSTDYGLQYYGNNSCEGFKEEELVPIDRKDLLVERIDKLLGEENE